MWNEIELLYETTGSLPITMSTGTPSGSRSKKEKPKKEDFEKMILGRTGNLRAPAIRKGKKLFIGFNEESLSDFFGIN